MVHLTSAVGRGCPNQKAADVRVVQLLLNRAGAQTTAHLPLKVDGDCGARTIAAIEQFQLAYVGTADGKVVPGRQTLVKLTTVAAEFHLLVATIYGEAANSSTAASKAILWVMKNRAGTREWSRFKSVADVIQHSRFDAFTQKNVPYRRADNYMASRSAETASHALEVLIQALLPVYRGREHDITRHAVLYYSPKAQLALHKKFPTMYAEQPKWNFSLLREVSVPGLLSTDDFKFYAYK